MSFQVGIGSLGGTVFFQVGLCTPLRTMEICSQNEKWFLTCLCHSPSQSQDEFENFCTNFDILFNQINDELPICSIVTGDFKGALSGLRYFLVTESP